MKKKEQVAKILRELLPKATSEILHGKRTIYSDIWFGRVQEDGSSPRNVVLKICRTKTPEEVRIEFENMAKLYAIMTNQRFTVPKPIGISDSHKAILMEQVDGVTLKQLLLRPKDTNRDALFEYAVTAADALFACHKSLERPKMNQRISNPYLLDDIDLSKVARILDSCEFRNAAMSYVDFSVWNLIVDKNGIEGLFLIDLPDRNCSCPVHLDLARFRYSLGIVDSHPIRKVFLNERWDLKSFFHEFLARYSEQIGVKPNASDLELIDYFEREFWRRLLNVYRKKGQRRALESFYMRKFVPNLIDLQ